ncbi:hypothetical protein HPB52_005792 [Rhipicephalus sanguineus]|uniref:Uncharacterized protein n=1 Tax=Rhipicephalus sanguineus TaxID=34632 RepID=A0A9D4PUQ1_RHISA|nr:hypothetical protein HPB52_005792 [Rhipicephalus sanguineus]
MHQVRRPALCRHPRMPTMAGAAESCTIMASSTTILSRRAVAAAGQLKVTLHMEVEGRMEVEAALQLFGPSLSRNDLSYTNDAAPTEEDQEPDDDLHIEGWEDLETQASAQDFITADDNVETCGLRSVEELVDEAESDSDGEDADVCDVLPSALENHHALDILRRTVSAGSDVAEKRDSIEIQEKRFRMRKAAHPDVKSALLTWLQDTHAHGIPVNGLLLSSRTEQLAVALGQGDVSFSEEMSLASPIDDAQAADDDDVGKGQDAATVAA